MFPSNRKLPQIGEKSMLLPSGVHVEADTPIYPGSNFTWGEATKNLSRPIENLYINGVLICVAIQIEKNIVATAKQLDKDRKFLGGRPLHINSWYRPEAVNRSVGGSKFSRHQYGDAVDIRSDYLSPRRIYQKLHPRHKNGGLARYRTFVHKDHRGHRARW